PDREGQVGGRSPLLRTRGNRGAVQLARGFWPAPLDYRPGGPSRRAIAERETAMRKPTGKSALTTPKKEVAAPPAEQVPDRGKPPPPGTGEQVAERLNGKYTWAPAEVEPAPRDDRPALALLCYEDPASPVGRFVGQLAGALARRKLAAHVFT